MAINIKLWMSATNWHYKIMTFFS